MSQAISNLSLFLPSFSSGKSNNVSNLHHPSRYLLLFFPRKSTTSTITKSMAGDSRGNLDHLQRVPANKKPQSQPKKSVAPPSPIGLWDRFPTARTVHQMMDTMDRIMEEPFGYSGGNPVVAAEAASGFGRGRTPWEIKEGETEYKMRFDMPGMTKDDVKVWVEEKMLVLKGEKVVKKKSDQENGVEVGGGEEEEDEWSAKSYGRYSCRIALPENIQFEKIRAEVKDGVLYITIPKAATSTKVLDINVQ